MEENKIQVYVKLDSNNCIIEIASSIQGLNFDSYIQIDKGTGQKYAHAQNYYLEKPLRDIKFRCNYKYENNKITELTEEEKELLFPVEQPKQIETEDYLMDLDYRVSKIELGLEE